MPGSFLRSGSHWQGPLLGRNDADGGLLENIPLGVADRVRSRYKIFLETFDYPIASAATFVGSGGTLSDLNTATAPTVAANVTGSHGFLLINPGTKAASGSQIQWNAVLAYQTTGLAPAQRVLPTITSTATFMDNRELIFATRIGVSSDTTAWDGSVMIGWTLVDTSAHDPATGLPALATGGGIGFHIGEDGRLGVFGQQAAITTQPAAALQTGIDITLMDTAATFQWYDLGFRWRCRDASDGTGTADFYVNGRKTNTITSGLPMASTEIYAVHASCCNGAARLSDLAIEYILMAITRAGHTNTSTGSA